MVGAADAPTGALFLLAQDGAQPSPDKPVEPVESGAMGMFDVAEPFAGRIEAAPLPYFEQAALKM